MRLASTLICMNPNMSHPSYDGDLYTDEALLNPYEHYRTLRDLGPAVWLTAHEVYAVTRYEDVRAVLSDPETFCSGQGVGLNDLVNQAGQGSTLMSDGAEHERIRSVTGSALTAKAVSALRPDGHIRAEAMVDRLLQQSTFDAVPDLAEVLPTEWVPDLLGWPEQGRSDLLKWGAANFDVLGPLNQRAIDATEFAIEGVNFAAWVASESLPEGSMAAGILEAAASGVLRPEECPIVLCDYLFPSLDTTVSGLGAAIWLFATHPDQWDLFRSDPSRARQAFDEVLRLETPVTGFTRVATREAVIGDIEIPAGARVLVSFASANRDERKWDEPERFDINRANASHLAFGYGVHACVGMGLARLEATEVLSALARRVERFELVGPPVRKLNNTIRAFSSLPIRIVASSQSDVIV